MDQVPLTPADCDLRDFQFMPLDVVRFRDSNLVATSNAEVFRCAVLLWCASWHQIPAASLPDDDVVLSHFAGFGRVVKEWRKHRAGALHGWIKCSDGRFYHPVVAEKACDSWFKKLQQRWKTECARIKKHNDRHGTNHPMPTFEDWDKHGRPQGQTLRSRTTNADVILTTNTVPSDKLSLSLETNAHVTDETESKGELRDRESNKLIPRAKALSSSLQASDGSSKVPFCPHGEIIALYATHLPELSQPRPELWRNSNNAKALQQRWRWVLTAKRDTGEPYATTPEDALTWFDVFFENVAASDFLCGRKSGSKWACDLGWLMKTDNFTKVIQGNYTNKGGTIA